MFDVEREVGDHTFNVLTIPLMKDEKIYFNATGLIKISCKDMNTFAENDLFRSRLLNSDRFFNGHKALNPINANMQVYALTGNNTAYVSKLAFQDGYTHEWTTPGNWSGTSPYQQLQIEITALNDTIILIQDLGPSMSETNWTNLSSTNVWYAQTKVEVMYWIHKIGNTTQIIYNTALTAYNLLAEVAEFLKWLWEIIQSARYLAALASIVGVLNLEYRYNQYVHNNGLTIRDDYVPQITDDDY